MPVAAVDKYRDSATGICDVGRARHGPPVDPVAGETRISKCPSDRSLGGRVLRFVGTHDCPCRGRRGGGRAPFGHSPVSKVMNLGRHEFSFAPR